jgi:WD40 repeat protein
MLALGTLEGDILLLDSELREVGSFPRQALPAVSLQRSENSLLAATGNCARLFDLERPASHAVSSYEGHSYAVTAAEFGDENKWLFTASEDTTVKIWDFRASGFQVNFTSSAPILCATLHGNCADILFGDLDGKVNVWDLTANRHRQVFQTRAAVTAMAVDKTSMAGEPLLLGLSDGGIFVAGDESDASSNESVKPFYPSTLSGDLVQFPINHTQLVTRCRLRMPSSSSEEHRQTLTSSVDGIIYCDRKKACVSPSGSAALDAIFLQNGQIAGAFFDGFLSVGETNTQLSSGICSLADMSRY